MYFGFYGYDSAYLALVLFSLVIGLVVNGLINYAYKKWSSVPIPVNLTGEQVARQMLEAQGVTNVGIKVCAGHLTDHYDPRDNCLYLSESNMNGATVASVAVACHEAGHALQANKGYWFYSLRQAIVPVVTFASNAWIYLLAIGIIISTFRMFTVGYLLTGIGILLFAFSVIFQLVTLPVEFNASHRAVVYIRQVFQGDAEQGAKQVLTAAALTYVAAALVSVLQLLYLINSNQDRS